MSSLTEVGVPVGVDVGVLVGVFRHSKYTEKRSSNRFVPSEFLLKKAKKSQLMRY